MEKLECGFRYQFFHRLISIENKMLTSNPFYLVSLCFEKNELSLCTCTVYCPYDYNSNTPAPCQAKASHGQFCIATLLPKVHMGKVRSLAGYLPKETPHCRVTSVVLIM